MSIDSLLRWAKARQMAKADYKVVSVESDRLFVIDLDTGSRSITNDAEAVANEIWKEHGNIRLIYRDSTGNWDEILSTKDGIVFKRYYEHLPRC